MPSDALYQMLAEALSKPSKTYRAAQAGLAVPQQALEGYLGGAEIGDKIRERRLARQPLGEALGDLVPQELKGLPSDQALKFVPLALAKAQLDKANQQPQERSYTPENYFGELLRSGKMTPEQYAKIKQQSSPSMYPKPEPGMRFDASGNLVPIPGGTPARKFAEEDAKKQASLDAQKTEADLVIKKINEALNQVDSFSAGAGAATKNVPLLGQATGATDLGANLDTILSSLGLGKLMELKSTSKAGASGMGALSDREMTLLTSALTSLKQSQDPQQLHKHLGDVKVHYQNILQMNQGINPFGGDSLGDPEADAAIAKVQSAPISENEKKIRIAAIRARATRGQ